MASPETSTRALQLRTLRSPVFNIDNGASTANNQVLCKLPLAITIRAIRRVYTTETAGTVAGATTQIGTASGGEQIVAAVACTNSAAVGASDSLTLVEDNVAANAALFIRHIGIAATAAGEYYIEMDYTMDG